MNKTLFAIVTVILLSLTSARYVAPGDARVGYRAPSMTFSNAFSTTKVQDMMGKYVVVTFWSSAQPVSRLINMELSSAVAGAADVEYVAVNMDRSQGLFEQLVSADGLEPSHQFHVAIEQQDKIMEQWRQQRDEFSSFLVSPEGLIVKINPTATDIANIAKH